MGWLGLEREVVAEGAEPILCGCWYLICKAMIGNFEEEQTLKAGNSRSSSLVRSSVNVTLISLSGILNVDILRRDSE